MWLIPNCFSHSINRNDHTMILSEIIWSLQAYKLELANSFQVLSFFLMEWRTQQGIFQAKVIHSFSPLINLDKLKYSKQEKDFGTRKECKLAPQLWNWEAEFQGLETQRCGGPLGKHSSVMEAAREETIIKTNECLRNWKC